MARACSLFVWLLLVGTGLAQQVKPLAPAEMGRLLEGLGSDKVGDRVAAARELGKQGPAARKAAPALERLLKDKEASVRAQAALALLKIDQTRGKAALAALATVFAEPDPVNGLLVFFEIRDIHPIHKDVIAGFLELAHSEDSMAVGAALLVLDNLDARSAEATPMLQTALKDPLLPIRVRAAVGLARIDKKYVRQALPILRQALADKDIDIRFHAASALIELNVGQQAAVLEALAALLKDPESSVRLRAARHLLSLLPEQTPAVLPVLIATLKAKDMAPRLDAIEILAAQGSSAAPAEEALRGLIKDKDRALVLASTQAVMRIRPEKAREVFPLLVQQRERDGDHRIRDLLQLIDKIYEISREEAEREHLKMLTEELRRPNKKEYVDLLHLDAALRLAALGSKAQPATGNLVKALDDDSVLVRGQVLLALARIGPEAKPAVPRLTEFYKDRDQPADLRQAAARALKAIDADKAKELGLH
jgi:HEAT repeat protein